MLHILPLSSVVYKCICDSSFGVGDVHNKCAEGQED